MYKLISIFMGSLTALMILCNGLLAKELGNYVSSVYIHLLGLLLVVLVLLVKGLPVSVHKKIPLILWTGGIIGYFTVIFTNFGYQFLGVSLTLSLSLFGQTFSSLLIDHFGWFGALKRPFSLNRLSSLFLILSGILVMSFFNI